MVLFTGILLLSGKESIEKPALSPRQINILSFLKRHLTLSLLLDASFLKLLQLKSPVEERLLGKLLGKIKKKATKTNPSLWNNIWDALENSSPQTQRKCKVKAENLAGNHVLKSTYLSLALQGISHTVLMPYVPQHTGIMGWSEDSVTPYWAPLNSKFLPCF